MSIRRLSAGMSVALLIIGLALSTRPLDAWADGADETKTKNTQSFRESDACGKMSGDTYGYDRLRPYKMNYAVWRFMHEDQGALQVQYSFKYDLYCEWEERLHEAYLSYTGKFDFYMFTRNSSPVINRTSNPAVHYRYGSTFSSGDPFWLDFAVEHRSDGQVTDATTKDENPASPAFGRYLAEIEYEKGNNAYFDGISRDSNYFSVTSGWKRTVPLPDKSGKDFDRHKAEIGVKAYFSQDALVTWGPEAGEKRFSDYDIVNVSYAFTKQLSWSHFKDATLGFEYVIGAKGFATDSVDLFVVLPLYSSKGAWKFPIILRSHFGPMERLSNYTQSMRTVSLGLALNY